MPFHAFMEQALYHPDRGYYASGGSRTGRRGDFLTPVSPGPVLGQLLARQAQQLHQALGSPKKIRLLEQGADAGWLARDLFLAIRKHHPDLGKAVELHLLEPFPPLKQKQKETLSQAGITAQWHVSWETVPHDDLACFFYSCELVDSFPIRIFRHREGTWREKTVGLGPTGFVWQEGQIDPPTLAAIRRWHPPEVEGFTVELRPGASPWVNDWSKKFSIGLALTLDYGFSASELFSSGRAEGTLVALRGHQRSAHPLADPGQQDLTAHVNFTELEELASQAGWENYGKVDFARGLTALAAPLLGDDPDLPEPWIRNFRHLTHPSFFGHTHKILVQGTSLPASFRPMTLAKVEDTP